MNYHHLHFIYWLLSIFLLYHIHIITPSVSCFLFLYVLFVCWGKSILKNPAFPDAVLNFSEDICNGRLTETQAGKTRRLDGWKFGFGVRSPCRNNCPYNCMYDCWGLEVPKEVFPGFPTAQQVKAVQSLMNATDFSVMTVGKSSVSWWNMEY